MVNPVQNAAAAFLQIWECLPLSIKSLFGVVLTIMVIWGLYQILRH